MKKLIHTIASAYLFAGASVFGGCVALLLCLEEMTRGIDVIAQLAACILIGALWPAFFFIGPNEITAICQVLTGVGG